MNIVTPDFITAGNATFTIENDQGKHYTFKVRTKDSDQGDGKVSFVSLLTGPDNESSYSYIGLLNNWKLRTTKKSQLQPNSLVARIFNFTMRLANQTQDFPAGYELHHEGRCCRCGRKLTTPESVKRGIGPECATKI